MFSHFIANKRSNTDVGLNYYKVSPNNHLNAQNYNNGGFWPSAFRNLWSSSSSMLPKAASSRSKYHYKDFGQADRYQEQRQRRPLIELQPLSSSSSSTQLSIVAEPCPTPPPMSPSMFTIPRYNQEERLYSPVKLAAAPERRPRRIQFRPDDCEELIEKFDKITIMGHGKRNVANGDGPQLVVVHSDEEDLAEQCIEDTGPMNYVWVGKVLKSGT